MKSQLRRYTTLSSTPSGDAVYEAGGLVINDELKKVTVAGEEVKDVYKRQTENTAAVAQDTTNKNVFTITTGSAKVANTLSVSLHVGCLLYTSGNRWGTPGTLRLFDTRSQSIKRCL